MDLHIDNDNYYHEYHIKKSVHVRDIAIISAL